MPRRARDGFHRSNIIAASTASVTTVGLICCSSACTTALSCGRNGIRASPYLPSSEGSSVIGTTHRGALRVRGGPALLTTMSSSADPVLDDRPRLSNGGDKSDDGSFAFDFPRSPKMRMKVYRRSLIKMVREKDVDGALALYTEATKLECQTTEGMFNTILNLCGDSGKVRSCLSGVTTVGLCIVGSGNYSSSKSPPS